MPRQPNHYRILDIALSADQAEIQHAYRVLAKRYHPDRVPRERREWARTQMARINAAYAVLGDPAQRATYDREQGYVRPDDSAGRAHGDAAHQAAAQPGHRPRREGQRRVQMSRQRVRVLGGVVALGILLLGTLYWWRVLAPAFPQQRWVWAALLAAGLVLVGIVVGWGRR